MQAPGHARRSSKNLLEQKTINLSTLSPRVNLMDENYHRARSVLSPASPQEPSHKIITYKKAVQYVRVEPRFLHKEDLKRIKVFPMREWQIAKNKNRKMSLGSDPQPARAHNWRLLVILTAVLISLIFIIVLIIFFINPD